MKILLIPLAGLALLLFVLLVGAIGLFVSLAVISILGQLWRLFSGAIRLLSRLGRRRRR